MYVFVRLKHDAVRKSAELIKVFESHYQMVVQVSYLGVSYQSFLWNPWRSLLGNFGNFKLIINNSRHQGPAPEGKIFPNFFKSSRKLPNDSLKIPSSEI